MQWTFASSLVQNTKRERAGWNYVPRSPWSTAALPVLLAAAVLPAWVPLPSSVLQSTWFEALSVFVGFNTMLFALLSLFQILPPIRRTIHRLGRPAPHAAGAA